MRRKRGGRAIEMQKMKVQRFIFQKKNKKKKNKKEEKKKKKNIKWVWMGGLHVFKNTHSKKIQWKDCTFHDKRDTRLIQSLKEPKES